jgi:hypothetical protein
MNRPWMLLAIPVIFSGLSIASAAEYPITGAWAYVQPNSPQLQDKACQAFRRLGLAKVSGEEIGGGELIVFDGGKRHNFGGYADDVTPNISIRKLTDTSFEVIDRWISDGEGGIRPGPHKRQYNLKIVDPSTIEIKEKRYPAVRYVKC